MIGFSEVKSKLESDGSRYIWISGITRRALLYVGPSRPLKSQIHTSKLETKVNHQLGTVNGLVFPPIVELFKANFPPRIKVNFSQGQGSELLKMDMRLSE